MDYSVYFLPLLSVLIGYFIALYFRPKSKKNLKLLLAFSGAFLLSLTVMHLLPEVYEAGLHHTEDHHHNHNSAIGIFIMIGIVFQIILEYFSKGAEHGHVHGHQTLHQIPWLLFFMLVFATMTPLGTYLSAHLTFLSEYYTQISGIVIGILFHISSTIIFETSEGHKFNLAKLTVIVLGIVLAYFI